MDNIRAQVVSSEGGRFIAGRLLPGTDLISGIEKICKDNNVSYGVILSAIGSFSKVRYLYVQPDGKAKTGIKYGEPVVYEGAVELLTGQGMIGLDDDDKMSVHFHGVMVNTKGEIVGGHFIKDGNTVLATIELTIMELQDVELRRRFDTETEFPLFNFLLMHYKVTGE